VLVRARRAGLIPWEWIFDGRTGSVIPWTVSDGNALAEQLLGRIEHAHLDRQVGQANRVEVWAEAMGWLPTTGNGRRATSGAWRGSGTERAKRWLQNETPTARNPLPSLLPLIG
jgi:hypothetical protein